MPVKSALALEHAIEGVRGALGPRLCGILAARHAAWAGRRVLLLLRTSQIDQGFAHFPLLGEQRSHIALETRLLFGQLGQARLEYRQLRLDVDLTFDRRAGEIFATLIESQLRLLGQKFMARPFFGEALGTQMSLRFDLAQIGAHVRDGRLDFPNGLLHDAFGGGIFDGVDEGVKASRDDPAYPTCKGLAHDGFSSSLRLGVVCMARERNAGCARRLSASGS